MLRSALTTLGREIGKEIRLGTLCNAGASFCWVGKGRAYGGESLSAVERTSQVKASQGISEEELNQRTGLILKVHAVLEKAGPLNRLQLWEIMKGNGGLFRSKAHLKKVCAQMIREGRLETEASFPLKPGGPGQRPFIKDTSKPAIFYYKLRHQQVEPQRKG